MKIALCFFLLLSLTVGLRAAPAPLDALTRVIAATKDICVAPNEYGFSVTGEVDAKAQAAPAKLFQKLMSIQIGASVKGQAQVTRGVAQKDLGSSLNAYNACAEHVFTNLLDRYYLTDIETGKPIKQPADTHAAFQVRIGTITSTTDAMTVSGSNNIQISNGSGTVILQLPQPARAQNNQQLVNDIALIVRAGVQIEQDFIDNNNADQIALLYRQWYTSADTYLSRQLDISYSAQFEAEQGGAVTPINHSTAGGSYWAAIVAKNVVLSRILTELRSKN